MKISKENWRVIINAICTLITTIIGAFTVTSCATGSIL
ncbi:MAG: smalltalk protein [Prevotella sp.]|nr:smalltalk protein [Prevotella sp.]